MDIGEGVVVMGLLKVDGVQNLDPVPVALQELSTFQNDCAFRISHHEGSRIGFGRALHQIGLQPKASFTAAGTADDKHVFIAGGLGVLGTAVHGEALRLGENDIILKHGVHVGLDVSRGAP